MKKIVEIKIGTIKEDILEYEGGCYETIISFEGENEDRLVDILYGKKSFLNHTNGFVKFFTDAFGLGCRGKYETKVKIIIEEGKIIFEEI